MVGEIGYDRREFLYDLRMWEIKAIIKGYRKRCRSLWESARMNAYFVMCSMADMGKAGIYSDTDLVKFPWEKEEQGEDEMSEEEVAAMREKLRRLNAGEEVT